MSQGVVPDVVPATSEALRFDPALLRRSAARLDDVRHVAHAGRPVLIAFALTVLYTTHHPLTLGAALSIAIATCIWQYALIRTASARLVVGLPGAVATGTLAGTLGIASLGALGVGLPVEPRALVVASIAVFASAYAWGSLVSWTSAGRQRVLLVGTTEIDLDVDDGRPRAARNGFDVVGAVPGAAEVAAVIEEQRPDVLVLVDDATYDAALERVLDTRANVRVATYASFSEYAFGRVPVEAITSGWFMSLFHPRQRIYGGSAKRAFDIVVASLVLVLTAPLLALLLLAAKLTGGHALFCQVRVGENGRLFTIYKIQTMCCDAERDGPAFASEDDPRITRLGRFLRRTHLDELPQAWNVLRGEMSIVGPRPERPEFIDLIEAEVPFWSRRLLVKPGVTGWAQIRCGYASDCGGMRDKLSYDLWYLRHRSLALDLALCVSTVLRIVGRPLRA